MKLSKLTLLLSLLVGAGSASAAIDAKFAQLEEFTDFSLQGLSEAKTGEAFKAALERFARSHLRQTLPEDYTLELTFTEIDMAGDIQPWRNRANADIRYVESVYPPGLEFSYVLRDPAGQELASGEENLRDLSFDFGVRPIGFDDSFAYELRMLKDWARGSIAPLTKK